MTTPIPLSQIPEGKTFTLPEPHIVCDYEIYERYNVGELTMPTNELYTVKEVVDNYSVVTGVIFNKDGVGLSPDEIYLDFDFLVILAEKPEIN